METKLLGAGSVAAVARLHRLALPDDILPALGKAALEAYYRAMLGSGRAELIGAEADGRLAGFILASFGAPSIAAALGSSLVRLAPKVAALAVTQPRLLLDAVLSVTSSGRQPAAGSEISYIAVHPHFQRRGVGSALVARLHELLGKRGVSTCRTKTLLDNRHVVELYAQVFARVEVIDTYDGFRRHYMFLLLSRNGDRVAP